MFSQSVTTNNEYEFTKWYKSTWLQIDISIKFFPQETAKDKFRTPKEMNAHIDRIVSDLIAQSSYQDSQSARENYDAAILGAIDSLGDKLKECSLALVHYKIRPMGSAPGCVTYSGPHVPSENEVKESKIVHPEATSSPRAQ